MDKTKKRRYNLGFVLKPGVIFKPKVELYARQKDADVRADIINNILFVLENKSYNQPANTDLRQITFLYDQKIYYMIVSDWISYTEDEIEIIEPTQASS